MNKRCTKCQKYSGTLSGNNCIDGGKIKEYYECSFCHHTWTIIKDRFKQEDPQEEFHYKPDLWWEKLPPKRELDDKSQTDPWRSTTNDILDTDGFDDTCNLAPRREVGVYVSYKCLKCEKYSSIPTSDRIDDYMCITCGANNWIKTGR